MRFEVLGPLRVHVGGREVVVRAGRDRTLLAMLALHADRTVPVDQLVDAVWSEAPPLTARNQVQACISQLRRRLSQAGFPEDVIATDPAGYRLRVGPEQVDVHQFRAMVEGARADAAAGRRAEARGRYRVALDLWRGPALAGIESMEVRRTAVALDEEHVQAIEERIELDLALGRAGELVGELSDLVERYPYREGLHAALMQALYRAGRMADALAAFRRARQVLRDELGAEPGKELQRLHQAILNRDPELTANEPRSRPAPTERPVPHELPPEVTCFVGRDKEIAEVRGALVPADGGSRRRPAVVLLYGQGGVGKSALAVRVAHELSAAFADGQLYVDLYGSTPGMRPLGALEVLGRFLRSLGVHPSEIPSAEAEAAALFRSVTADRRLLLLLDNAATKEQLGPLLPANPECAVMITSRHPQPTLDADQRLRVDVLADADGLALLIGLTDRLSVDAATQAILAVTGGLPLAIRIAGGRLACRPDLSAAEYAARLADRSSRLDELQLADLAVRASVSTSYDALRSSRDPTERFAAQAFRMLGLLHVPDVAPGVVAATLGVRQSNVARAALDRLVDAQLLEVTGHCRYRLHDLVRLVAVERASEDEPKAVQEAAIVRAMAFYTVVTWRADARIRLSSTFPFGPPTAPHGVTIPSLVGPSGARTWIQEELPNLVSVMEQAATLPRAHDKLPLWLGHALWNILDIRCAWQSAHRVSQLMLDLANGRGDPKLAASGLMLHGRSEACLGNLDAAAVHFQRALKHFADLDNQPGVALVLNGLGMVSSRQGRPDDALSYYEKALQVTRQHGLTTLSATVLNNMSVSHTCLSQLDQAIRAAEEGAALCSQEDLVTRTAGRINLAGALCLRGSYVEALECADEAIRLSKETGNRMREGEALIVRCEVNLRLRQFEDAHIDAVNAWSLAEMSGYRFAMASALRQQSKALAAMGKASHSGRIDSLATKALRQLNSSPVDPLIVRLIETPSGRQHHRSIKS